MSKKKLTAKRKKQLLTMFAVADGKYWDRTNDGISGYFDTNS